MNKQVEAAFNSTAVGKLTFYSPGTLIQYNVQKFNSIKELIRQGNIAIEPRKKLKHDAYYDNNSNTLTFLSSIPAVQLTPLLLHEFAHAIQDWMDVKSTVGGLEADAYIVQQVVLAGYDKSKADLKSRSATARAAAMVLNKTATRANATAGKAWLKTYKEVVSQVLAVPKYSRQTPTADRNETDGQERSLFNSARKRVKRGSVAR